VGPLGHARPQKTTARVGTDGVVLELQEMENSGNEAKESLKTKEVTFLNVHKKGVFAVQKRSFNAFNNEESAQFGEYEARLKPAGCRM